VGSAAVDVTAGGINDSNFQEHVVGAGNCKRGIGVSHAAGD